MGSISRARRILKSVIDRIRHHRRMLLAISLWLSIFIVVRSIMAYNNVDAVNLIDEIIDVLKNRWYGVVLFILVCVLRPFLIVPGTLTNLMGGMLYGFPVGFGVVVFANLTSASVMYSISRWLINSRLEFSGRTGRLLYFMQHNPFEAILTMQITYISTDLTSSLAGMLHLPYRLFALAIVVGGLVGNGLGTFIGSSIEGSVANGQISFQPEILIASLLILAFSLSLSIGLRRRNDNFLTS